MFVDKKLKNVSAVQTLSRLNRTCTGKTDTFVLDFVNTAEDLWDLVKDHRLKPCLDSPCNFSGIGQCTGL